MEAIDGDDPGAGQPKDDLESLHNAFMNPGSTTCRNFLSSWPIGKRNRTMTRNSGGKANRMKLCKKGRDLQECVEKAKGRGGFWSAENRRAGIRYSKPSGSCPDLLAQKERPESAWSIHSDMIQNNGAVSFHRRASFGSNKLVVSLEKKGCFSVGKGGCICCRGWGRKARQPDWVVRNLGLHTSDAREWI